MAIETVPFTREGYERLKQELETLKTIERPKIIREIADARAHGDLSENAEYHAAKEKQSFIEGRIAQLDDSTSRGKVVEYDEGDATKRVKFGAYVSVSDSESGEEKNFRIVGDLEADLANGLISLSSPIAKALMGKSTGDLVEIHVPKGTVEYEITEVRFK